MTGRPQSLSRTVLSAPLVASALIIILSATALKPVLASLAGRYRKESIAIRRPLEQFDVAGLASFTRLTSPPVFHVADSSDEAVGTSERVYIDLQEAGYSGKRGQAALFVTYYSDPEDKVPHTPDVCFRQAGTVVEDLTTITLDVPELGPERRNIKVRAMTLIQARLDGVMMTRPLVFVFCANGEFRHDRQQVRWIIARPKDKYVYFSKIEVYACAVEGEEPEAALQRCKKLLREAIPILVRDHYPSREDLTRR